MMDFSNVCSDIIFEILARSSSLTTLDTCKLVCKDWNGLVYESNFMPTYCEKTNNVYGYFVQNLVSNRHFSKFVSVNSLPSENNQTTIDISTPIPVDDMNIQASCKQGILCCVRRKGKQYRYYVCKPSTQQWQALPNPKLRFRTVKVALVVLHSNPFCYKIIRISHPRYSRSDCYDYHCEIFYSKSWSWRKAEDILLPYGTLFDHNQSVYASGLIYWLTSDDYVLAFNYEEETYHTFPLPELVCQDCNYLYKQLIEHQGKLGFICKTPKMCVQLWVVEDWKNPTWSLIKGVNIDSLARELSDPSLAGFYNADIALLKAFRKMIFYKLQDSTHSEIELNDCLHFADDVFPFRSDLEPINLRGG